MSEPTTVTVLVPGASASSSKMSKKGWKCWAKWLSSVDSPAKDGYAYHGEFASVGSRVECELGDVLLHVDQSSNSGIGVVMTNSAGKAFFRWVDATSDAKWAGSLAKAARRLLKMTRQERIARSGDGWRARTAHHQRIRSGCGRGPRRSGQNSSGGLKDGVLGSRVLGNRRAAGLCRGHVVWRPIFRALTHPGANARGLAKTLAQESRAALASLPGPLV